MGSDSDRRSFYYGVVIHSDNDGFAGLMKYADKSFWEKHKTIQFDTLTEKGKYEVVAAFKTEVYTDSPNSFRYYDFVNADTADDFNAYIAKCKPFKCDVTGNDKNYGFNVVNVNSTELVVFEAAIDLMSYVDIFADYESNKLALGMLADAPLETFLREHPQITSIRFCLDGDEPGRKAAAELMRKYYELGYEVEDCPPPAGYKDYNEWLVAAKLNLNRINKRADEPVRA